MAEDKGKGPERRPKQLRPCPICGKAALPDFFPFCSKRCADIDLNRWLSGAYVIPVKPEEEEDEAAEPSEAPPHDPDEPEGGKGRLN
jgi:endogenous inhibitor of DNA gyrase (YacG/DUF329 family)